MICCLISIYVNIYINLNSYVHIITYVHIVTYVKNTEICSEYDVNILVRQYELRFKSQAHKFIPENFCHMDSACQNI